jgi:hypothetical protein
MNLLRLEQVNTLLIVSMNLIHLEQMNTLLIVSMNFLQLERVICIISYSCRLYEPPTPRDDMSKR